jgi:hypothetical protein
MHGLGLGVSILIGVATSFDAPILSGLRQSAENKRQRWQLFLLQFCFSVVAT